MDVLISQATKRNWEKLNVSNSSIRLVSRANKTNSKKNVLPVEYFSNIENRSIVENILNTIRACKCSVFDAMYALILNFFNYNNLSLAKTNVQVFLSEYSQHNNVEELSHLPLPVDEFDVLGLIYQSLYIEGEKNKQGLYYTPANVASSMSSSFDFSKGQTFLDPCCGSGSFLLNAKVYNPLQLYGVERDPIAVMICKANLIVKFKNFNFAPQIYCFDYLAEPSLLDSPKVLNIRNKTFSYISTNPPWGAVANNFLSSFNTNETFACFLVKTLDALEYDGLLTFLLPESFLKVKTYSKLRKYILDNYSIKKIHMFPNIFTGVTTKVVAITIANSKTNGDIPVVQGNTIQFVNPSAFIQAANYTFSCIVAKDKEILDIVAKRGQFTLFNSTWALGIVTGNNAEKLLDAPVGNSEPIYTGKEISAYKLLPAKKHIVYNRANFQQVAKDDIYRADEKLVYKFISNKLVFAYDNTRSLFLNSANILIPALPSISILSMLVFLNSNLFQFIYAKQFGEIKILKGNLCELTFPELSLQEDNAFSSLANQIISGDESAIGAAQNAIYKFYGLSVEQIQYVKEELKSGTLT